MRNPLDRNPYDLDKNECSWYMRNIKLPVAVYFAKRAFKRNRLDTFAKWCALLPQKLQFVIDSKTGHTLHHYLALQVKEKNEAVKEAVSKKSWFRGRKLNEDKAKAVFYTQFFLDITYDPKYQYLQTNPEQSDPTVTTRIEAKQEELEQHLGDEKEIEKKIEEYAELLENGTTLQKNLAVSTLTRLAKKIDGLDVTETIKNIVAGKPGTEHRDSPEQIFLNTFSQAVPAEAELPQFEKLTSKQKPNQLAPYELVLEEIEKRIQEKLSLQAHEESEATAASPQPVEPQTVALDSFAGWLTTTTPHINLTQEQQQEQAIQTQIASQTHIEANITAGLNIQPINFKRTAGLNIEPINFKKRETTFLISLNKEKKLLNFYYKDPSTEPENFELSEAARSFLYEIMVNHTQQQRIRGFFQKIVDHLIRTAPERLNAIGLHARVNQQEHDEYRIHLSIDNTIFDNVGAFDQLDVRSFDYNFISTVLDESYMALETKEKIELISPGVAKTYASIMSPLMVRTVIKDSTGHSAAALSQGKVGYLTISITNAKKALQQKSNHADFLTPQHRRWLQYQTETAHAYQGLGLKIYHNLIKDKVPTEAVPVVTSDNHIPNQGLLLPPEGHAEQYNWLLKGKHNLLELINHLLKQHPTISALKLNDIIASLIALDQRKMDIPPYISIDDDYSLLSFFNDYVFQRLGYNEQGDTEFDLHTLSDLLQTDFFSHIVKTLTTADSKTLQMFFYLQFFAYPAIELRDQPVHKIVLFGSDEVVGKKTVISFQKAASRCWSRLLLTKDLPRYINNVQYLKKIKCWANVMLLLPTKSSILDLLREASCFFAKDGSFSMQYALFILMFKMDLTTKNANQIEEILHVIRTTSVPELNRYILNIHSGFIVEPEISPHCVDIRYIAVRAHLDDFTFDWKTYTGTQIPNRHQTNNVTFHAFFYTLNQVEKHCAYQNILDFYDALMDKEANVAKRNTVPSVSTKLFNQGLMALFLKYVQNPAIKTQPQFWNQMLEKYERYYKGTSSLSSESIHKQFIKEINEEIAAYDQHDFRILQRYLLDASIEILKERQQLPEPAMSSFILVATLGELESEDRLTAITIRNKLTDEVVAKPKKKDKRTAVERHAALFADLLPHEKELLMRLAFEEKYEQFKGARFAQQQLLKDKKIAEKKAHAEIAKMAAELEASAEYTWLNQNLGDKYKLEQFLTEFAQLKSACQETKNLSVEGLKGYIHHNQLLPATRLPATRKDKPYACLAAYIRMCELAGLGVPTQSQLYMVLHHIKRLQAFKQGADYKNLTLYELGAGEGKTLGLYLQGLMDAYFEVPGDAMTHQRDLAKTGAVGIQTAASEFFGLSFCDLYRQDEQQRFVKGKNKGKKKDTESTATEDFAAFQHQVLAKSDVVYLDVYDNMLQMSKSIHLQEGPRHDVRDAQTVHLMIDEVDHILDISAKVTAHIAEIEQDPAKNAMLQKFYRVLNQGMQALLMPRNLEALDHKDTAQKRAFSKERLLEQAQGQDDVIKYLTSLSDPLFDGWMNSALTVNTQLKNLKNKLYIFETETRDGQEVQVMYIVLRDTSGKVLRDAQWSAGVHQLLSDYWLQQQQDDHDPDNTEMTPIYVPALSKTILHTSVELLLQPYVFISGATATLGTPKQIAALKGLFIGKTVEIIKLPKSTPDYRFDFAPLITDKRFEDLLEGMDEAYKQDNEPLLIYFETIEEVEAFQNYIRLHNKPLPFMLDDKRRATSKDAESFILYKLAYGGVGLVTNAGGRGIDFKNIKRVLVASLPGTKTINQVLGRGGRFGRQAITQIIVAPSELGLVIQNAKTPEPTKPQRTFETTPQFKQRVNKARLETKREHYKTYHQKKVRQRIQENTKTPLFPFASGALHQQLALHDASIIRESQSKMQVNLIIDVMQNAVMQTALGHPDIKSGWPDCLSTIQFYLEQQDGYERAKNTFVDFANTNQIPIIKALQQLEPLKPKSGNTLTLVP